MIHYEYDPQDTPSISEINKVSIGTDTDNQCIVDDWRAWVETKGEIICEFVCKEGMVFIIRWGKPAERPIMREKE